MGDWRTSRRLFALAFLFATGGTLAQANPNALVTWVFSDVRPASGGYDETTTINCTGLPTCTGTYTTVVRAENCSNYLTFGGQGVINNLVIGPSTVTGIVTVTPGFYDVTNQANGTCTLAAAQGPETFGFTVSWNAATGTGSGLLGDDDGTVTVKIDNIAPPPVFPMVVQSSINAQTATASATIQFRPQDVGQSGGVFVFAAAPATRVVGGLEAKAIHVGKARGENKAGESCVLAQRNSAGQLVAVSAQQMQAFVTGAFAAQGRRSRSSMACRRRRLRA